MFSVKVGNLCDRRWVLAGRFPIAAEYYARDLYREFARLFAAIGTSSLSGSATRQKKRRTLAGWNRC